MKTKIITVTSGKGGVGKSNFSLNLAIAISKFGKSVALLDADLALGNADLLIGKKPEKTIEDIVFKGVSIDDILLVDKHYPNFALIPAGSGIFELTKLTAKDSKRLLNEIKKIKDRFDYLIIDTGAGISKEILSFVKLADEVVIVILPEVTSIKDSYSVLKVLKEKNVVRDFKILINRAKSKAQVYGVFEKFRDTIKKFLQLDVSLLGFLPEDENFTESVNRQIPIINLYPNSPTSKLFKQYAEGFVNNTKLSGIEIDKLFEDLLITNQPTDKDIDDGMHKYEVNDNNSENIVNYLDFYIAESEHKIGQIISQLNELNKIVKILKRKVNAETVTNSYFDNFYIGKEIIFVENNIKHFISKIVGFEYGKYIICTTNKDIDKLFEIYDFVTARYSYEDFIIEFKAKLYGELESTNLILITYPKDYLITKLRDSKRISVHIPCKIMYKNIKPLNGMILDLSLNGALISTNYPCDVGDMLQLSFVLPNGKEIKGVNAIIRNIREKNRYGVSFEGLKGLNKKRLDQFIEAYKKLFSSQFSDGFRDKISGDLTDFSFFDLIQLASSSAKDYLIEIYSDNIEGKLYIKGGEVIHSVCGDKIGLDAFYELSLVKSGEFYMSEFVEDVERTINEKTDVLLLNAAYYNDSGEKNGG